MYFFLTSDDMLAHRWTRTTTRAARRCTCCLRHVKSVNDGWAPWRTARVQLIAISHALPSARACSCISSRTIPSLSLSTSSPPAFWVSLCVPFFYNKNKVPDRAIFFRSTAVIKQAVSNESNCTLELSSVSLNRSQHECRREKKRSQSNGFADA